jgi:hypothetical protein
MKIIERQNFKQMAHIIDGKVVNISLWDGVTQWKPVEEVIEISDNLPAGIGWDYVNGQFVNNNIIEETEVPDPEPTPEELARASALAKLQTLGLTEEEALALIGG